MAMKLPFVANTGDFKDHSMCINIIRRRSILQVPPEIDSVQTIVTWTSAVTGRHSNVANLRPAEAALAPSRAGSWPAATASAAIAAVNLDRASDARLALMPMRMDAAPAGMARTSRLRALNTCPKVS